MRWRSGGSAGSTSSAAQIESARARLDTALQAFRAFKMQEELLGCLEDLAALVGQEGDAGPRGPPARDGDGFTRPTRLWPRRRAQSVDTRT